MIGALATRLLAGVIVGLLAGNMFAMARLPAGAAIEVADRAASAATAGHREPDPCVPAPLAERAGQVLVVGLPHVTDPEDPLVGRVLRAHVGGILLTKTNVEEAGQVRRLVDSLRARAATPLSIATDEEPGRVSSFGALLGRTSSARTLAARLEPHEVRDFARDLGGGVGAFGVDVVLAPVADLDDGPAAGIIGDRSFSADPWTASAYALAFSHGLASAGVQPAVKHFPGHGRSRADSHRRLEMVDVDADELLATDVIPFAAQVGAGVPIVMLGHVGYTDLDDALPASLSPAAYAMLRDLGFAGVAMTDSIGMGAVNLRWDFADAAVLAIRAGADAVLATDGSKAPQMRNAIVRAVVTGALPEARLNEAVARMYRLRGLDPRPVVCIDVPFPVMRVPAPLRAVR